LEAREDTIMAKLHAARHKTWSGRIVERRRFSRLLQMPDSTTEAERARILDALAKAGIETIHIREERRLSTLGTEMEGEAFPIQVREERLGRASLRPLHEVSVLLERYNQVFVIENVYCPPEDFTNGIEVLRSLEP
jgi:hypothetical protein